MGTTFNDDFMLVPRSNSPVGSGDVAIRNLKEAIRGVLSNFIEGFEVGNLEPLHQNRMRMGTARATVGTATPKPSDSGLTERDVGRLFYPAVRGLGAGHMNRPWVVVKFGEEIFWAPIPDGYVNDIKFVEDHTEADVSTVKSALTSSVNPGWFRADGRTITLPAELGGARTLPNLVDGNPYLRFGEASALPTGAHAKKIVANNLPEHTHSLDAIELTTELDGAHEHSLGPADRADGFLDATGIRQTKRNEPETTISTLNDGEHQHTINFPATTTNANSTTHTNFNVEPRRVQLIPIIRIY